MHLRVIGADSLRECRSAPLPGALTRYRRLTTYSNLTELECWRSAVIQSGELGSMHLTTVGRMGPFHPCCFALAAQTS